MINEIITLNNPQQLGVINAANSQVDIWGRGTGKSFGTGWEISQIIKLMPRSITSITGQTYGQLLTRTLPSTFKFLESKLGYERDKDYVIGCKPPDHFKHPYEPILDYKNFISFANGTGFLMLSQDRKGSSRGPNVDREIVDEALTINKARYDEEVGPTNRANKDIFGKKSGNPIRIHNGFHFVSSMPYTPDQKWLLDFGKYYEEEAGIILFEEWNRIVMLQLEMIKAAKAKDRKLYCDLHNEVVRRKKKIVPFISKTGTLFTLANAFDNINNLGLSYIIQEYDRMPLLTFLIEILNYIIDKVEDCYYSIDNQKHVYYDATNDNMIRDIAEKTNWDFEQLQQHDSRMDLDCDTSKPLEIVPDWGAHICLFSVGQERNYNFATKIVEPVDCVINEFFLKPDQTNDVIINELVDNFSKYYANHACRELIYYRDRYGDSRMPNAKNSKPYNEQAIDRLKSHGFNVIPKVHAGQEPPQHEKYLLWANILKGSNPKFPKVIINGKNCKYTLISMNNTKVKETNGRFEKDKSSERKQTIPAEEATHFSDAVDKRIWTKYSSCLFKQSTFVEPRL